MKRVAKDDIDESRLRACSRSRSGIDSLGKRSDITLIPTLYRIVGKYTTAVLPVLVQAGVKMQRFVALSV